MTSLGRLYRLLSPLHLYALGQNSLIDRELESYGGGFALLEARLEQLRQDMLPQTATSEGLGLHEAAVGLPVRDASAPSRLALILARTQRPYLPTLAGAAALLEACGMVEPQLYEEDGTLYLSASGVVQGLSPDLVWNLATESLPAHLAVEPNGQNHNWDSLDELSLLWETLDTWEKCWSLLAFTSIPQL